MQDIHVRVDDQTAEQLRQLAGEQDVPISAIVRRAVKRGVQALSRSEPSLARAHEITGRVQ